MKYEIQTCQDGEWTSRGSDLEILEVKTQFLYIVDSLHLKTRVIDETGKDVTHRFIFNDTDLNKRAWEYMSLLKKIYNNLERNLLFNGDSLPDQWRTNLESMKETVEKTLPLTMFYEHKPTNLETL